MKRLIIASLAFLLLVDALVLGKIAYNRLPLQALSLTLTERELSLPGGWKHRKENSGVSLHLAWQVLSDEDVNLWGSGYWQPITLSRENWESFNFYRCEYKHLLEHQHEGWVLVELAGPTYAHYVKKYESALSDAEREAAETTELDKNQQEKLAQWRKALERAKVQDSRLMVLSAAAERQLLLPQLAQLQGANPAVSYGLIPAFLRPVNSQCKALKEGKHQVFIDSLAVSYVNLPKVFAEQLVATRQEGFKGHYEVELAYGRLYEPWIKSFSLKP